MFNDARIARLNRNECATVGDLVFLLQMAGDKVYATWFWHKNRRGNGDAKTESEMESVENKAFTQQAERQ